MQLFWPQPTRESPSMFASQFVDRFSRTHWAAVPVLYVPAMAMLVLHGKQLGESTAAAIGFVLLGVASWTLAEYWLHRLVFHWQPEGAFGERMHFVLHGVHHKWPRTAFVW